ncbi:hypothetical protein XAC908_810003 [Xanthomonas citri pv. citri]|nr:hypothetical protein XAC908_810003 [Xanthomonas citri pv. citri]
MQGGNDAFCKCKAMSSGPRFFLQNILYYLIIVRRPCLQRDEILGCHVFEFWVVPLHLCHSLHHPIPPLLPLWAVLFAPKSYERSLELFSLFRCASELRPIVLDPLPKLLFLLYQIAGVQLHQWT